jgi:hypothetical protein
MKMRRFSAQNNTRMSNLSLKKIFILTIFLGAFVSGLVLFYMSVSTNKMSKDSYSLKTNENQNKQNPIIEQTKMLEQQKKTKLEREKKEAEWLEQEQKRREAEKKANQEIEKKKLEEEIKKQEEEKLIKQELEQKKLEDAKKKQKEEEKRKVEEDLKKQQEQIKKQENLKKEAEEKKNQEKLKKLEEKKQKKEKELKEKKERELKEKKKPTKPSTKNPKVKEPNENVEKKPKTTETKKPATIGEKEPKKPVEKKPKTTETKKPTLPKIPETKKPNTTTGETPKKPVEPKKPETKKPVEKKPSTTADNKPVEPKKPSEKKPKSNENGTKTTEVKKQEPKTPESNEASILKGLKVLYLYIKESEDDFIVKFPECLECLYRMILVKAKNPAVGEKATKYMKKLLELHFETYAVELKGVLSEDFNKPLKKKTFAEFMRFIAHSDSTFFMKVLNHKDEEISTSMKKLFTQVSNFPNATNLIESEVFGYNTQSIGEFDSLAASLRTLPRDENGVIVKKGNTKKFFQIEKNLETIFQRISQNTNIYYHVTRSGFQLPGVEMNHFFNLLRSLRKFYYLIPVSVEAGTISQKNLKKQIYRVQYETYKSLVNAVVSFVRTKSDYGIFKFESDDDVPFLKESIKNAIIHKDAATVGSAIDALIILGQNDSDSIIQQGRNFLISSQNADGVWEEEEVTFKGLCNSLTGLIKHDSTKTIQTFVNLQEWEDVVKKIKI